MDENTVKTLAQLSFLNLTDGELAEYAAGLAETVDMVNIIKDIDVYYDPLKDNRGAHICDLREDKAEPDYPMDKLLRNAVHSENCFVVPKVVE